MIKYEMGYGYLVENQQHFSGYMLITHYDLALLIARYDFALAYSKGCFTLEALSYVTLSFYTVYT